MLIQEYRKLYLLLKKKKKKRKIANVNLTVARKRIR
jgi:hypothetical protein